jgi:CBS domain-containing protein
MQIVSDIMTTTVRTIHRDTMVCEAEGIFVKHKISGAPLIDDSGDSVGFVSKSDVTRFYSTDDDPNCVSVYEIASPKVMTIKPSASLEKAAQKMVLKRVDHLVVMADETMVGVLSVPDFVKIVAENPSED